MSKTKTVAHSKPAHKAGGDEKKPKQEKAKEGHLLISTPLGKEAGVVQAGNKPWLNILLNILFSLMLLVGFWPLGLLSAGLDIPPMYTNGVWIYENVEAAPKTLMTILGAVITVAAIALLIWWNLYYRKKRRYYLAMTDSEREEVFGSKK